MKRLKNITLIILTAALCGIGQAYGDVEVEQGVEIEVPPTVTITKSAESVENATVNAATGVITGTGIKSVFTLQTNGTDDDYEFVMSSTVQIEDDVVSGYAFNGNLLFTNTTVLPTLAAVNNAKSNLSGTNNVIVYPVTVTAEGSMVPEFHYKNATYGDYYKIYVNGDQEQRRITHSIGSSPANGTYDVAQDEAGTYQAVVTFTAVAK